MPGRRHRLGTVEASEALLEDLYLSLRTALFKWAAVTHQTPQPRMGYVGQHLASVVTGHPGGRSGARGKDLILDAGGHAEIKTCYRVDQLGSCRKCGVVVASIEAECPSCHSEEIKRNDDSKWLIGVRTDAEMRALFDPKSYYLVLFDFADLATPTRINARIYEVDPWNKGFAYCMVDYFFNIRAASKSKAPFNLWPFSLKFHLMLPELIYHALIDENNQIETLTFPGARGEPTVEGPLPLPTYSRSTGLTSQAISDVAAGFGISLAGADTKAERLQLLEDARQAESWENRTLASAISEGIYGERIQDYHGWLPVDLRE